MAKKRKRSLSRQTGTSRAAVDKKIRAKSPGKRVSRGGNVYYERRKNRSDKPGSLLGVKLKRFPKKPKASASTSALENYLKRVRAVQSENSRRVALSKSIGKIIR